MSQTRPFVILGAVAIFAGLAAQLVLGSPDTSPAPEPRIAERNTRTDQHDAQRPALSVRSAVNPAVARAVGAKTPALGTEEVSSSDAIVDDVVERFTEDRKVSNARLAADHTRLMLTTHMPAIATLLNAKPDHLDEIEALAAGVYDGIDAVVAQVADGTLSLDEARARIFDLHAGYRDDVLASSSDPATTEALARILPEPVPFGAEEGEQAQTPHP